MNKFQGKIVQVMGSLSHLRKGLENVRNTTIDEAAEVPVVYNPGWTSCFVASSNLLFSILYSSI